MSHKPNFITKDHMKFLNEVCDAGVFDIMKSLPVIEIRFPKLNKHQCLQLLNYWMDKRKK